MRIVTLSDTHNKHNEISIPEGDVVVHAGDATLNGTDVELRDFCAWYAKLPHRTKIFVAGNHDRGMVDPYNHKPFLDAGIIVLQQSGLEIDGVKFWGSPYSRFISSYWAFGHEDGVSTAFSAIPDDTNVLITHGPPAWILDLCPGGHVGSVDLADRVGLVVPALHVFGHIHESYGVQKNSWTTFVNTAILDGKYRVANAPHVLDLDPRSFSVQRAYAYG